MQQYSRRNCIRVFGIPEEQEEDTDDKICRLGRKKLGADFSTFETWDPVFPENHWLQKNDRR